jgi:lysophospholipid acyltransferase (LPLAT)-like uncharacterized protein
MGKFLYRLSSPAALLVRALSSTYRIEVVNGDVDDAIYERGEVPIYCSWHQRWFAGITFQPRRHPIGIMISQSEDGEFISRIVEKLGWRPARGSSTRGGKEAFRALQKFIQEGRSIGHIVDGPKGPFGEIKPGLFKLAQFTGMPIVAFIVSPEKKWVFNSWDRFMVPKPFSRVIIRFEKEIYVPRRIDQEKLEELRKSLEERMRQLYRETDARWQ